VTAADPSERSAATARWSRLAGAGRAVAQGRVVQVVGTIVESVLPNARVGDLVALRTGGASSPAEVVGFRDERAILMPFGDLRGVGADTLVVPVGRAHGAPVGDELLGRVLDAFGRPLDGGPPPACVARRSVHAEPPRPLERAPTTTPAHVGIRAIDALLPCARGQRLGIFAAPGLGKSVLVGMMARGAACDRIVIALVGERGREVGQFVRGTLGVEGLRRAVVVASTSDRPPLERIRAAWYATTVAEDLRDRGHHVLLVMDSLTRFAMAQREVGLAAGEPPTTRGYTPSVFAALPRLVERLGPSPAGSITGFYTVLTEGDDVADPVAEAARSLLDGHVQLDRELAERGHFPAIDVLRSVSRVALDVMSPAHVAAARAVREHLAVLHESRDLLAVGAYRPGANPRLDAALAVRDAITAFLRQGVDEPASFDGTLRALTALASQGVSHGTRSPAPAA
jgi:flagellum-specific ATP synthase